MAGISSAWGNIAIAKQTVKGTPAATPAFRLKAAGAPSLMPYKDSARYNVTDINRAEGPRFTTVMGVRGDIPLYAEPAAMALFFFLVLGTNVDSGAGPFVHTETPALDVPYCTIWRMVGGQIIEQFMDCKINRLQLEGSAGGAWMLTIGVEGIQSTKVTDPVLAALEPAGYLFPEIKGAAKFDTVAQTLHHLSLEIQNNVSPYQADDFQPKDIDPGKLAIAVSFGTRFTGLSAFPDYSTFFYAAGSTLSPVVGDHALDLTITRAAGLKVQILVPRFAFAGVPVTMDPGGAPIDVEVQGTVEQPTGGAAEITAICTDAVATV